jgi:hypothetical protein
MQNRESRSLAEYVFMARDRIVRIVELDAEYLDPFQLC